MDSIGIDSKPKTRRGRRFFTERLSDIGDHVDDITNSEDAARGLNIRVKERENAVMRRGLSGSNFKDSSLTSVKSFFNKEPSSDLKGTLMRPLTGLFRRPASRSGGNRENIKHIAETEMVKTAVSPEPDFPAGQAIVRSSERDLFNTHVLQDIAKAPNVSVNRIAEMYQLDFINPKTAALVKLDDIDLSLLSCYLCPEEEVKEEDVPWTWDYLFASVSTELREEWAQDDERTDDGNMSN